MQSDIINPHILSYIKPLMVFYAAKKFCNCDNGVIMTDGLY